MTTKIRSAVEMGILRDSGERQNGEIVWKLTEHGTRTMRGHVIDVDWQGRLIDLHPSFDHKDEMN